ncbi:ribbon-helix-helix protein, CopG family [Leptospira inadai serovar Lyme str. 10]|uniref:Ribbon-helix-helix protein, CopG family n=2 Tax=Leptospira inadai serovar Lyme TaxID=293084 RepID=V6HAG9_9LEPT|nr:toxin-antitoxin system HicB family antitoxin [Leptospira inadai]EQA36391.1 ribbon-helix-helix protein, CopG family [Leptospira inadai serovar Lyme str. 10]PNV74592.1 toxin-antitoxin system HicB family antitoxin [Leptospira inadai serovar Lyme]
MKAKASILTIRIPSELKHKIERVAEEQGVSINQLALYAFTKEIQDMETSQYFEKYYKGKSKKQIFSDFREALSTIKSKGSVPDWDKL